MIKIMRHLLPGLAVILLFIGAQIFASRGLVSGVPPSIEGRTLDGQSFALSQLRGRPAVIYFWASWCPVCRIMQSNVQSVAMDYSLISLALQSGDQAQVSRYMSQEGFKLTTLLDTDGATAQRFGIRGVPSVFILGPDGNIRFAVSGYTSEFGLRVRLWLAGL